jgi:hypothetical protein
MDETTKLIIVAIVGTSCLALTLIFVFLRFMRGEPAYDKAEDSGLHITHWEMTRIWLRGNPRLLLVDAILDLRASGVAVDIEEVEHVYIAHKQSLRHRGEGEQPLVQELVRLVRENRDTDTLGDGIDDVRHADSVAEKTQWGPKTKGKGAYVCTHRLVRISPERVEFRPSIAIKIFCLGITLFPIGIMVGAAAHKLSSGGLSFDIETFGDPDTALFFFGLIILVLVIWAILSQARTVRRTFDKRMGLFWRGRETPDKTSKTDISKSLARLEDIHALQLVSEWVYYVKAKATGNATVSSYDSFELNLVLKNAKRINVVDHAGRSELRRNARTLAEFLDKPLWDAIDLWDSDQES